MISLLSLLKKLFAAPPKIERVPLLHPVLGPITYSEEEEAWLTEPSHASLGFRFSIAGEAAPDARLLAHAESVARDPVVFRQKITAFLEAEAQRWKNHAETVRRLEIAMVCLFWPERPDDGMIFFAGGESYGLWRCDYKNRAPLDLGFDS